jgi:hypothetical protein
MSIAVLHQVYDETRRLAIAGSSLAAGDFRLKKLVEPLRKSAEKAPVFGKVADAIGAVVESNDKSSAGALLELSTLVNAILYTQGETGVAGELQAIDTVDMNLPASTAGARVLKPLIEALTTTGSGRLEIITEAHQRGAFRDIRLVKPALAAIDDPYPEIADFVTDEILPMYGKAIYTDLRAGFDPKGRGEHVRRLRLLHRLDPEATRPLVTEVLESGSKEVRIQAMKCLDGSPEALPYLLEQATAKAKDVREAALTGLAAFDDEQVVETFIKALSGADVGLAAGPASKNPSPKLLKYLHEETERQFEEAMRTKDKKKQEKAVERLQALLTCFHSRRDKQTEAMLIGFFERYLEIGGGKASVNYDYVAWLVAAMLIEIDSKRGQRLIIEGHEMYGSMLIEAALLAAIQTLPPEKVYELFSPYYLVNSKSKKKNNPVAEKQEAVRNTLELVARKGDPDAYYVVHSPVSFVVRQSLESAQLDPRWLDAAIEIDDAEMVQLLARPGHKAAQLYLSTRYETAVKKRELGYEIYGLLEAMNRIGHPRIIDHFVEALEKAGSGKRTYYNVYWLARLIPDLPPEAAPKIEALIPTLNDKVIDDVVPYLDELKQKA